MRKNEHQSSLKKKKKRSAAALNCTGVCVEYYLRVEKGYSGDPFFFVVRRHFTTSGKDDIASHTNTRAPRFYTTIDRGEGVGFGLYLSQAWMSSTIRPLSVGPTR